jgi:hypothetical protein
VNPSSTLKSVNRSQRLLQISHDLFVVVQLMLSGLEPQAILEIAGNAISFWNYQKTQENEILKKRVENYRERAQSFQLTMQRTKEDNAKVVHNLMSKLEQVTAQNQQLKMQDLEKSRRILELERKAGASNINHRSPSLF